MSSAFTMLSSVCCVASPRPGVGGGSTAEMGRETLVRGAHGRICEYRSLHSSPQHGGGSFLESIEGERIRACFLNKFEQATTLFEGGALPRLR